MVASERLLEHGELKVFAHQAVESFIRGYHFYKDETTWDPQLEEKRDPKREPGIKRTEMLWW